MYIDVLLLQIYHICINIHVYRCFIVADISYKCINIDVYRCIIVADTPTIES